MTKKHFTLQRAALSLCLFLSVFLMAFSCQDHVVPDDTIPPAFQTIDATMVQHGNTAYDLTFPFQFTDLGNKGIKEYGTLLIVEDASAPQGQVPDINSHRVSFKAAPDTQLRANTGYFVKQADEQKRITYRAYAELVNGTVVLGTVKTILTN